MSDELTVKQKLFIKAYLANGYNATQAAISAGYSEDSAREIGSENLTKPLIQFHIDKELKIMEDKFDISREWILKKLKKCIELSLPEYDDGSVTLANHTAFLGSVSEVNKMQGYYQNKKEVEDKLDDLQEKLEQLVEQNKKDY